ncbi:hypothetical protein L5515_005875 [Caenorhabditis briggsae]|uniref:Uncharacterized protein n=1 Tax=Caenorhabditis briggsae TaxID=6238 RepID=A0AAE9CXE1_CAEBR|nr:hypothetical protein L3Y34_006044 [Caenorhabditis briggsae]UMM31843.1 hypothetical protein L5515_005875 [Caenorhabditis briggsae]
MKNILLVLFVVILEPFHAQDNDFSGRLMMMDKQMRRLNLTDIHFMDPHAMVKVDTVVNAFNFSKEDLKRRLLKNINETAIELKNSNQQQLKEWRKKVINLPHPIHSSQIRYHNKTGV